MTTGSERNHAPGMIVWADKAEDASLREDYGFGRFEVVNVTTAAEALKVVEESHDRIRLLILDPTLPAGDMPERLRGDPASTQHAGYLLAREIRRLYPSMFLAAFTSCGEDEIANWFRERRLPYWYKPSSKQFRRFVDSFELPNCEARDFANPESSKLPHLASPLAAILKNLEDLKQAPRSGDIRAGIPLPSADRVSGHIFFVSTIALLVAHYLRNAAAVLHIRIGESTEFQLWNASKVDIGALLEIALVHDWGEAFLGDVDRGAKKTLERMGVDINGTERLLLEHLLTTNEPLATFPGLVSRFDEFESYGSGEAVIVRLADYVEAMAASRRLFSANDSRIEEREGLRKAALDNLRKRCPELADFLAELIAVWPDTRRAI